MELPVMDEILEVHPYSCSMHASHASQADAGRPMTVGKYLGQVKWWNDKLGFGFATICDGPDRGRDIFVHHTGIRPATSSYRTLRKGEYISFNITNGQNGEQAVDVTGVCGGSLMCDVGGQQVTRQQQQHQCQNQPQAGGGAPRTTGWALPPA